MREIGMRFVGRIMVEDAVVVTVRVAVDVPLPARVMLAGLKLQLASAGSPSHIEGERAVEPPKPLIDAKVRTVDPDCPGAAMAIVVGFADTVNVGCGATWSEDVSVVAPRTADSVTVVFELTLLVVTEKLAVVLLKGTVTVKGTVAMAVLELARVTTMPPDGAAEDKVTVPCEVVPPVTVVGLRVRAESIDGCTVMEAF